MNRIKELIQFLNTDIWRIPTRKLERSRSFWINQLRILLLAVRGFDEDKCQLRASALTFYSLLSIVPVVAMAFGIAKGFGLQNRLETLLVEKMAGQEEVVHRIIDFANSLLEHTQGGVIAGVGVAFLFWTVIKLLGNIEKSFNDIWGLKKERSLTRKFSDYLAIMMVCPLLLIMASSLTVFIASQVELIVSKLAFLGPVGDTILWLMALLPFVVMWFLFSFIYLVMPNTHVQLRSALLGALVAGTSYQVVQWIYIHSQILVSRYGAVYGSFAALPLFLLWLQISWLIVLFGAEISFAEQNVDTYEFEPDCLKASRRFKRLIALGIAQLCVKRFDAGEPPLDANSIADALEAPIRLINLIIFELTESGILAEVKLDTGIATAYQPARNIGELNITTVLEMMDRRGEENIPFLETEEIKKIRLSLANLAQAAEHSPDNVKLKDL